jgi:MFS family permease
MSNSSRDAIEAVLFKPAAGGGFVFQAPKPWLFGKAHNYLANEAQKAEILTIMAPNVPVRRRGAIIGAFILGPVLWALAIATLIWAISDHDEPTAGDGVVIIILVAVPILLALFLALAWSAQAQLAKLTPLIARLQPTEEQITAAYQRRGMARSMSFRALLTIIVLFSVSALISAFTLGMRMAHHTLFTGSTVLIVINLVIPLVGVAAYFAMALLKAAQGRESASY